MFKEKRHREVPLTYTIIDRIFYPLLHIYMINLSMYSLCLIRKNLDLIGYYPEDDERHN